jgi:hypothetical protein
MQPASKVGIFVALAGALVLASGCKQQGGAGSVDATASAGGRVYMHSANGPGGNPAGPMVRVNAAPAAAPGALAGQASVNGLTVVAVLSPAQMAGHQTLRVLIVNPTSAMTNAPTVQGVRYRASFDGGVAATATGASGSGLSPLDPLVADVSPVPPGTPGAVLTLVPTPGAAAASIALTSMGGRSACMSEQDCNGAPCALGVCVTP